MTISTHTSAKRHRVAISATLLLLAGLASAADVVISVDSTGSRSSNGLLTTNNQVGGPTDDGTATFTVTFSEAVYPTKLGMAGGLATATTLDVIFDGVVAEEATDAPGTAWAAATWKMEQTNGTTFKVYVSGIDADRQARVTIDPTKFYKVATGVAFASATVAKSVEFIEATTLATITVVQPDYFGFLNAPTVSGAFTTGVLDAVVNVTGTGITGTAKVDSLGAAANWSFAPTGAITIGYKTYVFTGKDAAGNAAAAAAVTRSYYVWNQPAISTVVQQTGGSAIGAPSSGNIFFNNTKPTLTGTVGIPHVLAGGAELPEVKVDIFAFGTSNPVVSQMTAAITAGASAGVDSAVWTVGATEWGTNALTLSDGVKYDIVLTMKVTGGGKSSVNSVNLTRTLEVKTQVTAGPTLPAVTLGSGIASPTSNHTPTLTITGPLTNLIKVYKASDNSVIIGAITGSGPWTFTPTAAFANGVYGFYATWTDSAGNESVASNTVALTISTPTPVVALLDTSPSTKHKPRLTITADTDLSTSQDNISVGTGLTAVTVEVDDDGAGANPYVAKTGTLVGSTWTPTAQLADGTYDVRVKYTEVSGAVSEYTTPVALIVTTPTPKLEKPTVVSGEAIADSSEGNTNYLVSTLRPRIKVTDAKDGAGTTLGTAGTLRVYRKDGFISDAADIVATGTEIIGTYDGTAKTWTGPVSSFADLTVYSLVAVWRDENTLNSTNDANGPDDIAANTDDESNITSVKSNIFHLRTLDNVDVPAASTYKTGADVVLTRTNNTVNTSTTEFKVSGTCNKGATIRVFRNGTALAPKTVGIAATTWEYTFLASAGDSTPLINGANQLTFSQTDLCGVTSALTSPAINVFVDARTPNAPTITGPVNNTTTALVRPVLTGTAEANTSIAITTDEVENPGPPVAGAVALTSAATVTTASNGQWTYTPNIDLTDGKSYSVVAKATSAGGLVSAGSNPITITVAVPALTVAIAPLASGTGSGYKVDDDAFAVGNVTNAYVNGQTLIKVKIGTGVFYVGDSVTISGGLYTPASTHTVTAVTGTSSATTAITISPGIARAIARDNGGGSDTIGVAINAQPSGPAAGAPASSLTAIKLMATFTEVDDTHMIVGGDGNASADATENVVPADFTVSDVLVTNGVVQSLVKGTGLPGFLPTNVWTITLAPSASGTMAVSIPRGLVKTASGKYVSDFTSVVGGANYVTAPKVTLTGGGGVGATATATFSGGAVTDVVITNKGWGYTSVPTVNILPVGSGATGTAVLSGITVGTITRVAAGTGYTVAPNVLVSSGQSAVATPVVGTGTNAGKITSVTINNAGDYYTTAPVVTVDNTGAGGTNFAATALISGGKVTGFTITTPGSGYTSAPAITLTAVGSGATATATLGSGATAGTVTAITVTAPGTGYLAVPRVILSSGNSATAVASMQDFTVLYSAVSNSYSKPVNRIKPTVTWKYPISGGLLPLAAMDTPLVSGATYYKNLGQAATVRLAWSASMGRDLLVSDLQLSTGCTATLATVGGGETLGTAVGETNQIYDVLLTPASLAVTSMSVSVKAIANLVDTAVPAQSNLASLPVTVRLVASPTTGPNITSSIGGLAPQQAAKTPVYPCVIVWPTPVVDFTADKLVVTNGVISKFTGTGTTYSFTLTPGEGLVSVEYDNTKATVTDVTGNVYSAKSNLFTRLMDSSQPTVVNVSSPSFQLGGGAAATATLTSDAVSAFTISNGGTGYDVAPDIAITSGSGATATATLGSGGSAGTVTALVVANGGESYTTAPTVAISGGGGSGATATATLTGTKVTGFTVTAAGSGYTTAPTVTLTSVGSGATATAVVTNGVITGVTLGAGGTGYTATPLVVIRNGIKPMVGANSTRLIPVRVTFSEAPKAFPTTAVVASAFGKDLVLKAPKVLLAATASLVGPQLVPGTGGRTYEFDLEVPVNAVGNVRVVVPSQGVIDTATNPSAASGVYTMAVDLINGTPVQVTSAFADG